MPGLGLPWLWNENFIIVCFFRLMAAAAGDGESVWQIYINSATHFCYIKKQRKTNNNIILLFEGRKDEEEAEETKMKFI